jgi:hypothetical protein
MNSLSLTRSHHQQGHTIEESILVDDTAIFSQLVEPGVKVRTANRSLFKRAELAKQVIVDWQ